MNRTPETLRLADLEAALDTYGADRTRWPAPLRHALSGLIASSEEAQKLLDDAERFDRLLDMAPGPSAADLARLSDRIVAAAERQPRMITSRPAPVEVPRRAREFGWAAAALAASLVLGILAGQSRLVTSATDLLAGASQTTNDSGAQLAFTDDIDGLADEDLL